MTAPMNRHAKRIMAKQGTDKPRGAERKAPAPRPTKERTGPRQYFREVMAEMKKVAGRPARRSSTRRSS